MISEAQKRATAKYKKDKVDAVIFSFDKKNSIPFQKAVEASGKSRNCWALRLKQMSA